MFGEIDVRSVEALAAHDAHFTFGELVGTPRHGRTIVYSGDTRPCLSVVEASRRLRGGVSLEKSVRGRVVMVTGASSGIGKSAAVMRELGTILGAG